MSHRSEVHDRDFPGADNSNWSVGLLATWTPFDSGVTNAKVKQSDSGLIKAMGVPAE